MRSKLLIALCLTLIMLMLAACDPAVGTEDSSAKETSVAAPGESSGAETDAPVTTAEETRKPVELKPVSAGDIPAFSGGIKHTDYNCGDGVYMHHVTMVLPREYTAYVEKLPSLGYTEVNRREYGSNYFCTFAKDGTALIASYFGADSSVRLTILPYDPYDAYDDIYGVTDAPAGDAEPLFTMVSTDFVTKTNGMSYIIRTPKGSFIIIDGGWTGVGEAKKILDILKSQNTRDGVPVVAAWILTHPHSDHIGAISEMASIYYDEIKLERVIFNFVDDEILAKSDSKAMLESNSSILNILRKALSSDKKWAAAAVIKPHTGDLLNIDGVTVEILHTHEDVYPKTDDLLYNNANSLAFRISAGGHSAMITGDLSGTGMKVLAERYGAALKSDILQPTHHGTTHGQVTTYNYISPSIVMWDTSASRYAEYENQAYNQLLVRIAPRHYISGNGTVTVSLTTLEEIKANS